MREIGPFVDDGYSLFWAVEGRGRKSVTLDLRTAEGQDLLPPARGDRRRRRRELPARHARAVEHRPRRPRPAARHRAHLDVRPGRPVLAAARPRPRRHRLRRAAAPHRLSRPAAGARRRHDLRLPHRRVRRAGRGRRAVRTRRARRQRRGDRRRALRRGRCASSSGRSPRTTGSASSASREGNRLANSAPLDNYPTADGKYVCIVAGSDANFSRLCKAMDRPDLLDDPRFTKLADRAAHSDEINGIVAEWTATLDAARRSRSAASRTTCRSPPRTPRPTSSPTRTSTARGDLVTVDDPVIGPIRQQAPYPALRRRAAGRARRRAAPRRAHRRGAARAPRALDAELDALRAEGRRSDAARADRTTACSSSPTTARSRLLGGYSPTSGQVPLPAARHVPVLRRRPTSQRVALSRDGDAVGLDRGHRRAARLRRPGAVRLRRRRARARAAARHHPAHASPIPTRLDVRPADARSSPTTLPTTAAVVTWAFAP